MRISSLPRLFSPTPLQTPQNVSPQSLVSSKYTPDVDKSKDLNGSFVNFSIRSCSIIVSLISFQSCLILIDFVILLALPGVATDNTILLSRSLVAFDAWYRCSTVGCPSIPTKLLNHLCWSLNPFIVFMRVIPLSERIILSRKLSLVNIWDVGV